MFADLAATTRRGIVVAALRSIVKNANGEETKQKKEGSANKIPTLTSPLLINQAQALSHPIADVDPGPRLFG
jgi:hypothetical protein